MKVRAKTYVMFSYGLNEKAYVSIYPKQKWEVFKTNADSVEISRNNVTLQITKRDFDRYFKEVQ